MEEFNLVYRDINLRIFSDEEIKNIIKNHFQGHVTFENVKGEPTYSVVVADNLNIKVLSITIFG